MAKDSVLDLTHPPAPAAPIPTEKVYFVYDPQTIVEAEVLGGTPPNPLDLRVSNILVQKFITTVTLPPTPRDFLKVRKGSRVEPGTYFTIDNP